MSVLSEADVNAFKVISLGHKGVGKTVFLAGSYTELRDPPQSDAADQIWVESADSQTGASLESLLSYTQTGQYPPTTESIASFDFNLKRNADSDAKPLCRFCWQDIPGDRIQLTNLDFQSTVLKSHGCFVFINADALEHDLTYQQQLDNLFEQSVAIASLAAQHDLVYPLAIILTQCDRLTNNQVSSPEIKLQAFLTRLEATRAVYKSFASAILISQFRWQSTGAAAPLLWLLSELTLHQTQPPQNLGDGLRKSLAAGQKLWAPEQRLSATVQRYMSILALANISQQALPVVENLVREEPELEWDFDLAYLYESRGQKERAEIVYNRILTQQENNLRALMAKAMLRHEQGDLGTAKTLLQQALKAAPNRELKAKIYTIAQQTLGQAHLLTDNTDA